MAAPLMEGFTVNDYAAADQLGYTREQFERLGSKGARDALNKKTSYVQPTSVMPQMQNQQMSYKTPDPQAIDLFAEDQQMSYNTPDGSKPGQFELTPQPLTTGIQDPIAPPVDYSAAYSSQNGFNIDEFNKLDSVGQGKVMDSMNAQKLADEMGRADSFDWLGAGDVALQGVNTAMEIGMYGDKKDYMQNVNAGLEQNMQNAQATHDNRTNQQQNLGSTFSRNA